MRFRGLLLSSTFVLALIALALGGNRASAQVQFTCDGKIPTISGLSGVINGTSGDDVIIGSAGNDIINGGSGTDLLVDPQGFGQTLDAGSGNDTILGNGVLLGGSGNDAITVFIAGGADANLSINAGSGTDTCNLNGNVVPTTSCELP
jgi:Ca2+-binding RTX toxin-like protein